MTARVTGFQRQIHREFRDTGLDYKLVPGRKHFHLYIQNKMAMVISNGQGVGRDLDLLRSKIRRALGAKNADHGRAV